MDSKTLRALRSRESICLENETNDPATVSIVQANVSEGLELIRSLSDRGVGDPLLAALAFAVQHVSDSVRLIPNGSEAYVVLKIKRGAPETRSSMR
jgi:hypothetical protein